METPQYIHTNNNQSTTRPCPTTLPRVYIDVETTGVEDQDQIIEFAAVEEDGSVTKFRVKPTVPVHPAALKVNGYTEEGWADAISQEEAAQRIAETVKRKVVVAHNLEFDRRMINHLLKKYNKPRIGSHGICTLQLALALLADEPGHESVSLVAVCYTLGIPYQQAHTAEGDAKLVREVFRSLSGLRKQRVSGYPVWVRDTSV